VMEGDLATAVADFLTHKRALGRKYLNEEATLRLLVAFMDRNGVTSLAGLNPGLLDGFVGSRPRTRAGSVNLLVGTTNGMEQDDGKPTIGCPSSLNRLRSVGCLRRRPPFPIIPGLWAGVRPTTLSLPCVTAWGFGLGKPAGFGWRTWISAGSFWSCTGASPARAGWCPSARRSGNCSPATSLTDASRMEPGTGTAVHV
jgi:hypothetical protein